MDGVLCQSVVYCMQDTVRNRRKNRRRNRAANRRIRQVRASGNPHSVGLRIRRYAALGKYAIYDYEEVEYHESIVYFGIRNGRASG